MTPTTPELLTGVLAALAEPPPPESSGEFTAGRVGVVAMIAFLAAQEAERGVEVRVRENEAIRALFARVAPTWDVELRGILSRLAEDSDCVLTLSALDSRNAELRTALIALQTLVEASDHANAAALRRDILGLLKQMADGRALHLPPMPPRT